MAGANLADGGEIQVVEKRAPQVELFAVRPAWVRVQAANGSVILEKILDAGERYTVPQMEEPSVLRAGNSGSVYFAVNGKTLGPAGPGTSVAKNVVLSSDALMESYREAETEHDPELAKIVAIIEALGQ